MLNSAQHNCPNYSRINHKPFTMIIKVCTGPACTKNFSNYTLERAEREAAKNPDLQVETCGCQGNCRRGPTVVIVKSGNAKTHNHVNGVELKQILNKKGA